MYKNLIFISLALIMTCGSESSPPPVIPGPSVAACPDPLDCAYQYLETNIDPQGIPRCDSSVLSNLNCENIIEIASDGKVYYNFTLK